MTREELNEIAESFVDTFLVLMESMENGSSLSFDLTVPGKPRLVCLVGINERADQIKSFSDAMGMKDIPIVEDDPDEMPHRFTTGDQVLVTTTAQDHPVSLRGAKGTVVRILGDEERDPEVGPMYEVRVVCDVFEDELDAVPVIE